jgi:hypothetical protein
MKGLHQAVATVAARSGKNTQFIHKADTAGWLFMLQSCAGLKENCSKKIQIQIIELLVKRYEKLGHIFSCYATKKAAHSVYYLWNSESFIYTMPFAVGAMAFRQK